MPYPVKVVLVTMYGPDGDRPGELDLFREAENLQKTHPSTAGAFDIWSNEAGLVGLITGVGASKAAAATMAFGLDPRFDLSNAYFLIAGIAGINPNFASLAGVAWADYCVDGDLAFEIDPREIPDDWPTGILPLGANAPYAPTALKPGSPFPGDEVFSLNPALTDWAFDLTKDIDLSDLDSTALAAARQPYADFPEAQGQPAVLRGDNLSSNRFWHGQLSNDWAERWVEFWTRSKGRFVTASMEDAGTLHALNQLALAGKIDWNRILLLRSGSNYTMPPPAGPSAAQNLLAGFGGGKSLGENPGYLPSLQALQRVGSAVIRNLIENWDRFQSEIPSK